MQRQGIDRTLFFGLITLLIGLMFSMGIKAAAQPIASPGFDRAPFALTDTDTVDACSVNDVGLPTMLAAGFGACCTCDQNPGLSPTVQDTGYVRLARAYRSALLTPSDSAPPREPPRI